MTNEEAIDFINNKIQIDVRFCSDDNINETKTALTLAIEALEKQIPKKVTEDEIIDALECRCCVFRPRCSSCPHQDFCCIARIATDGLNLIRKQQTEIERLKCEMGKLSPKGCSYAVQMEVSNNLETKIRAEAIREFWNRLKAQNTMDERIISVKSGDELIEEMAGNK